MKKQTYAIIKTDWCLTIRNGNKTKYFYGTSKKEVLALIGKRKGTVQIFKLSYEFKDVKEV